MKNKIKKNQAFTLIEILVVATIIGVLVTMAAVSFASSQKRSRDARRKADLETVRQALVLYRQDNGSYGDVSIGFDDVVEDLYDDGYLTASSVEDPKSSDPTYFYSLSCEAGAVIDCNQVELTAILENDPFSYEILTP
jgi:prepilin-type N-terminal cleavage/methylation domain-containing protein